MVFNFQSSKSPPTHSHTQNSSPILLSQEEYRMELGASVYHTTNQFLAHQHEEVLTLFSLPCLPPPHSLPPISIFPPLRSKEWTTRPIFLMTQLMESSPHLPFSLHLCLLFFSFLTLLLGRMVGWEPVCHTINQRVAD